MQRQIRTSSIGIEGIEPRETKPQARQPRNYGRAALWVTVGSLSASILAGGIMGGGKGRDVSPTDQNPQAVSGAIAGQINRIADSGTANHTPERGVGALQVLKTRAGVEYNMVAVGEEGVPHGRLNLASILVSRRNPDGSETALFTAQNNGHNWTTGGVDTIGATEQLLTDLGGGAPKAQGQPAAPLTIPQ